MMRALFFCAICVSACVALVGRASAYTLRSGLTDSCHERMTAAAFGELLDDVDLTVDDPPAGIWDEVARATFRDLIGDETVTSRFGRERAVRFVLFSLVAGVRAPDTGGYSTGNLSALRRIHLDPDSEKQYAHALRAARDDGLRGELRAVRGTRALLRSLIEQAIQAQARPYGERTVEVDFFLELYGQIEVSVFEPMYLLGQAIHALQDSHSHTIRSDDGAEILHVLNFVEAISGNLDPGVDGLAHSDKMDDCFGPVEPLVERAESRTTALAIAAREAFRGDESLLDRGLSRCPEGETERNDCGWIEYVASCENALREGLTDAQAAERCCTRDNDFCGSRWLEVARQEPSEPYLEATFGCSLSPPSGDGEPNGGLGWWMLAVLSALLMRRRAATAVVAVAIALTASSAPAHALDLTLRDAFAAVELHGSTFSGDLEGSFIDPSFGFAARGGYRFEPVSILIHAERNYWVSSEVDFGVLPGVLNVGAGAEILFADDRLRSSLVIGASILRFDAALDESGTTGFFLDVRPVGVRFGTGPYIHLVFDPIVVSSINPALGDPGIHVIQFRTVLGVEGHLP